MYMLSEELAHLCFELMFYVLVFVVQGDGHCACKKHGVFSRCPKLP